MKIVTEFVDKAREYRRLACVVVLIVQKFVIELKVYLLPNTGGKVESNA